MSTTTKHITQFFRSAIYLSFVIGGISLAHAQTWYDSQGRALTVKGREVRLQTEKDKRKTLPMFEEEKPSIVRAQIPLRDDLPIIMPKGRFRNNQFFGSRFRFRNSSFSSFSNFRRFSSFRRFSRFGGFSSSRRFSFGRPFFSRSRTIIKRF